MQVPANQLCIFHEYVEILSWATGVCQHQGLTSARHGPNISYHWAYADFVLKIPLFETTAVYVKG